MVVSANVSLEQRLQRTRRLLQKAERAQVLAMELTVELADAWSWEPAPRMTPSGYVLGPSPFDAEVSAERLTRLRHELSQIVHSLERQAAIAH